MEFCGSTIIYIILTVSYIPMFYFWSKSRRLPKVFSRGILMFLLLWVPLTVILLNEGLYKANVFNEKKLSEAIGRGDKSNKDLVERIDHFSNDLTQIREDINDAKCSFDEEKLKNIVYSIIKDELDVVNKKIMGFDEKIKKSTKDIGVKIIKEKTNLSLPNTLLFTLIAINIIGYGIAATLYFKQK